MAVLKMQKISICALKKDRKAILEQLQHLGVLKLTGKKKRMHSSKRWTQPDSG